MASPVQSHFDNFNVIIDLALVPQTGIILDFSKVLAVTTLTESSGLAAAIGSSAETVGTNSVYGTLSESSDVSSGIGDPLKNVLAAFFGAKIHPDVIQVVAVDTAGSDTYASIAAALTDSGKTFYSVICVDNDAADIADVVEAFNNTLPTREHIVFAGLDDITDATTLPSDLTSLTDARKERLYLTYHDQNGSASGAADFAEICALYAATDWDNRAAGGNLVLRATPALGPVTEAQKGSLDTNNVNHALPLFGTSTYVDKGEMLIGTRPVYHMFTADWLENRLQLAIAQVKADYANRRLKLPLDSTGQAVVLSGIKRVIGTGVRAQHLLSPEEAAVLGKDAPFERAEAIDSGDITARRLRFTVKQYFLEDAREITVNVFLSS